MIEEMPLTSGEESLDKKGFSPEELAEANLQVTADDKLVPIDPNKERERAEALRKRGKIVFDTFGVIMTPTEVAERIRGGRDYLEAAK